MEKLQHWQKIKEIVGSALERPPAERGGYLDRVCSQDSELRAEVDSLLSAYHDTQAFPENPWHGIATDSEEQPKVIGAYRLVKELGSGGMGQVWLAEQAEPVRRQVALKLIRAGMYDASTVQRFKAERQSLAIMDHPAIAKVFDAGTTPAGQPYLVMEYVDGPTITDYCDAKKLRIRERLQLFIRVCEGVQHAHQKAIIHRDLKPSNILVVEVDGKPMPRIIDFGLAKATTPLVPGETVFTQMGAFLGTPGYMSPEQAEVEQHDVDTRTDVYSLGAILYELLTGFLPFDTAEWKKQRQEEFLRKLREEDPPRPSTKISADREGSWNKAEARSSEVKQLASSLRGDLDWITMKALEKERNRRYGAPSELAADVERYLDNRAVKARPASASYRAKKFLVRNKFAVASALAVFVALVVGLGVALWQARIARTEAQTSQAVQSFLGDIFRANSIDQADPIKGRHTTAAELLDSGASKIDLALGNAPEAKLRVLEILGQMYDELELNEQAATVLRKRIQLTRQLRGPMAPALAQALVRLAISLRTSPAAGERDKALQEATYILDHNRDFNSRTRARLLLELADGCWDKDLHKALRLTEQAVKIDQAYQPDRDTVSALIQEGVFHTFLGQPDLAEASYYGALTALDAIRPATNHDRSQIYTYLGQTQRELQKFDAAEKSQRLAFQVAESVGGAEHQLTLIAQMDLGWFLFETGRSKEGLATMASAEDSILKTRGADPQTVPYALNRYGRALLQFGRLQEGDSLLAQAEESLRKYRPGSGHLATVLDLRAAGLTDLGRYAEAQSMLDEASQIHANIHDEPIYINENLLSRSRLLLATGKPAEAIKILDGFYTKAALPGTISLTWARGSLVRAEVEFASQRPERTVDLAASVRVAVERSPARAYLRNYEAQAALTEGKGLLRLHRQADALPLLTQAVKLSSELYDGARSPSLADAHATLAECLDELGEYAKAQSQLAQATAIVAAQKQLGEHIGRSIADLKSRLTHAR